MYYAANRGKYPCDSFREVGSHIILSSSSRLHPFPYRNIPQCAHALGWTTLKKQQHRPWDADVGLLVGWSVCWLVGRSFGWLTGCLAGWLFSLIIICFFFLLYPSSFVSLLLLSIPEEIVIVEPVVCFLSLRSPSSICKFVFLAIFHFNSHQQSLACSHNYNFVHRMPGGVIVDDSGSLLLWACSMCDVDCSSAITSHCLLFLLRFWFIYVVTSA